MTLREIRVGDVVRVDGDLAPWRVEAKDEKTGMLSLVALDSYPRVEWDGVYEFRCEVAGAFK